MFQLRRAPDVNLGVRSKQFACLAIISSALALAGCQKSDEITRYTVAKPPPREGKPADAASSAPQANVAENVAQQDAGDGQHQLLGAIVPHGKMTWFFKLTGPSEAVGTQMQPFAQFLRSIKFTDKGPPEWVLPEGWEAEPGSEMRFATIRITTADEPLEMSVIPLPTGDGSLDDYLLSNVNRWRGQFGLAPIAQNELAEHARKIELGETMWLVKFEGRMAPSAMGMKPPGAKASAPRKPKTAATAGRAAAAPFDCEIPEGWVAGQAGQFQLAVYEVHDGDKQAVISVSSAGGDLAGNVNRWRGQVQLPPLDAADLDKEMHKIKVDGQEGIYVEAIGPESTPNNTTGARETILGVIVEAQGRQWFIKLKGDAELAAREKTHFEKFVQSIRFRGK